MAEKLGSWQWECVLETVHTIADQEVESRKERVGQEVESRAGVLVFPTCKSPSEEFLDFIT